MYPNLLLLSRSFFFFVLIKFSLFSTLTDMMTTQTSITVTGDRLALLAIKSKIKYDPQRVLSSWNDSGTDFCLWQGVICSARHKRVIILNFTSRGLIGTLSPSIGNLSFIRSLWFFGNSFSGEIPPEIGRLFRLRTLILRNNSFSGNIPASMTNCSRLRVIELGDNNLGGKIPDGIGSLPMLKSLFLYENLLEGRISQLIANLTSLEILSLRNCQLGGSFPNVFQRLKNLSLLSLTGNNLVGTISPSFYNCSSLKQIFLDNNQLTGRLHLNLGSIMPNLKAFSLYDNQITYLEKINTSMWSPMKKLIYLDISQNHIRGRLNVLNIPATTWVVDFSSNELSGSLDHFLCSNGVKDTQILNLGNNYLSGFIPECWEKWPSLQLLNLENNNLSGVIPITVGYISSLELLNLRGNKISGRLPSSLMNLSQLEVLQLGRNELVGNIPTWIGKILTLLRILNLRSNNFYGRLSHELCYLSYVQILDLAHNKLFGNIPRCFNNFSILSGIKSNSLVQFSIVEFPIGKSSTTMVDDSLVMKGQENTYKSFLGLVMLLDLSSNNFSGQIPSELTTLHELKSLNLSRNRLSGRIPENIGDMKALESFDLSLNKLNGEIPMSLSKLNFMSSFNVSYNNLRGRVPTGTQIQSFNKSGFYGNKLCGAPLTNSCMSLEVPGRKGDKKENEKNQSFGEDWGLIISTTLGFVTGFWIIVILVIVKRL